MQLFNQTHTEYVIIYFELLLYHNSNSLYRYPSAYVF